MTDLIVVKKMGREISFIRQALINHMCKREYQKLATRSEKDNLTKALKVISDYRSLTEDYFLANKTIDSINVFYGLGIKQPPYVKGDICPMCDMTVTEDDTSENLTKDQLVEYLGRDIQIIKRELENLKNNPEYEKSMDKDITDLLEESVNYIDKYIKRIEDRLIKNNVIVTGDVFHNLEEGIAQGAIADICLLCHQE